MSDNSDNEAENGDNSSRNAINLQCKTSCSFRRSWGNVLEDNVSIIIIIVPIRKLTYQTIHTKRMAKLVKWLHWQIMSGPELLLEIILVQPLVDQLPYPSEFEHKKSLNTKSITTKQ